jgi:hypothetical protein
VQPQGQGQGQGQAAPVKTEEPMAMDDSDALDQALKPGQQYRCGGGQAMPRGQRSEAQ